MWLKSWFSSLLNVLLSKWNPWYSWCSWVSAFLRGKMEINPVCSPLDTFFSWFDVHRPLLRWVLLCSVLWVQVRLFLWGITVKIVELERAAPSVSLLKTRLVFVRNRILAFAYTRLVYLRGKNPDFRPAAINARLALRTLDLPNTSMITWH